MDTVFLGTHMPHWLGEDSPLAEPVPMCVSRVRLHGRRTLPRARGPWILDSGGFSALSGEADDYTITPRAYAAEVRRYRDEIGNMVWAAPMDRMCEPHILRKVASSVPIHLRRTVESVLELRWIAPDLRIIPVLQGWRVGDYLRCADLYEQEGVDLAAEPVVGIGSVCRRQGTLEIADLVAALNRRLPGGRFHGFGVKTLGLGLYGSGLHSSDSLSWSKRGLNAGPCTHGSGALSEANCPVFALSWYRKVLAVAARASADRWVRHIAGTVAAGEQVDLFAEEQPPVRRLTGTVLADIAARVCPELGARQDALAAAIDSFRSSVAGIKGCTL